MTVKTKITWDDTILPFQLDRSDIRGRVLRLDGTLDTILSQHNYPPAVEALVAEAAMLTALIGQTIKMQWKLSLQVRGDGPARLIATDYFAPEKEGDPATIRAYASYDADRLDAEAPGFAQIGKGYFAILIHQGSEQKPYTGMTPITGQSLSDCAQAYFAQSEQLPSRFHLTFGKSMLPGADEGWRAGGVMLQQMPKASVDITGEGGSGDDGLLSAKDLVSGDEAEDWNRANILLDSVEELELVGPSVKPTDLLVRLFHEEEPRVFDPQPLAFGCPCSEERVRESLSIYSARELRHMITEDGRVTAGCQFCGAQYDMDPATLGKDAIEPVQDRG